MQALKDSEAWKWIIGGVGKIVLYNIKKLCLDQVNSVLKSKKKEDICDFPWCEILDECLKHYLTLLSLLLKSTTTKTTRQNQAHFVCAVICMLAKFHRSNMSLLQKLISMLLILEVE